MNDSLGYCPVWEESQLCLITDQPPIIDIDMSMKNASLSAHLPEPCLKMASLTEADYPAVMLMNSTHLLMHLGNQTSGFCTLVLFYAVWCPFSMQLAPAYNALGRLFPTVPVVAVDVKLQYNTFATNQLKFGTTAVPNLLIFEGLRTVARYNKSTPDLSEMMDFLVQHMKLSVDKKPRTCGETESSEPKTCPSSNQNIESVDYDGPVPVKKLQSTDWLLFVSVFILLLLFYDWYKR